MESMRTRSRGKETKQQTPQRKQDVGSWRVTTDETDVDEDDEERSVPVVSGENKRKRAPRGGNSVRRVKLKPLRHYEEQEDKEGEASGSTEDNGKVDSIEQGETTSGADNGRETDAELANQVEKRQSSRVKIKSFKLRENAEPKSAKLKVDKKDQKDPLVQSPVAPTDDQDTPQKKAPETPQKPLRVRVALPETKLKVSSNNTPSSEPKQKTPVSDPVTAQQKPVLIHKAAVPAAQKPSPSTPDVQKTAPTSTPNAQKATAPSISVQKSPSSLQNVQKAPPSNIDSKPKAIAPTGSDAKVQKPSTEGVHEEDLETAHKIIKKIMKMDAAQPFNKPVDPVAQGVPDYLDVIDTPMDFGTINENLEKRQKYKTALDVHRDVQQIWANCRKYNHKGDPILELMKKVQKACSKYWTAAGVLRDPKRSKKDAGEVHVHEQPSEIFIARTTSHLTDDASKSRPGAGTSNHRATCGCVVCVAVRRRVARERRAVGLGSARAVKRQIAKMKSGKQGMQDLNDLDMEELMQLDEAYLDQEEEADQFYPASYQIPLRPIHPSVLSISQALFGCRAGINARQSNISGNPFAAVVSTYAECKQR